MNHSLRRIIFTIACLLTAIATQAQSEKFTVRGRVVDRLSREPVIGASVSVQGLKGVGAATDTTGVFVISGVDPGICRLYVSCIGYKSVLSAEYFVSAKMPTIEIELAEDAKHLNEVTVSVPVIRRVKPSPVSMQIIGLGEIEKSPGGNRDISRIVRSVPGVSFSPIGYRNDLIVRGGSPSENKFFMDGIEIPNINHFATQGASGGPVSILNADLIREVQFYTARIPV